MTMRENGVEIEQHSLPTERDPAGISDQDGSNCLAPDAVLPIQGEDHGAEWRKTFDREQGLLDQLAQDRRHLEDDLAELAEKERRFSQQVLESARTLTQNHRRQAAEREAASLGQIESAGRALEAGTMTLVAVQETIVDRLEDARKIDAQRADASKAMLAATHDMLESGLSELDRRTQALGQIDRAGRALEAGAMTLVAVQETIVDRLEDARKIDAQRADASKAMLAATHRMLESGLSELDRRTQVQDSRTNRVHERLDAYLSRLEFREREFATQLEVVNRDWTRRIDEDQALCNERARANAAAIQQAQQRIEHALDNLAAREGDLARLLSDLERASERHHQDKEQHFASQLQTQQRAYDVLHAHLTAAEQRHQAAYDHLVKQVAVACSALPWRWLRPLRSLRNQLESAREAMRHVAGAGAGEAPTTSPAASMPGQPLQDAIPDRTVPATAAQHSGTPVSMTQMATPVTNLAELFSLYDERFVAVAYHTLLRRAPDAEGMRYYLARLRAGVSKVELIAQLHLSPEGQSARIHLAGLDDLMRSYKRKKMFSPLNWFCRASLLRAQEQDHTVRAIENKLNVMAEAIQRQFAEISHDLHHLNTLATTGGLAAGQPVPMPEVPAVTLEAASVAPVVHDPIARRYEATLAAIAPRFTAQGAEPSKLAANVRISILMPVYKVPLEYLAKAIESVSYQSYANWELCIVDDGSNDATLAQFLHDAAARDERIHISIETTNRGISGATNIALKMATGQYIALLDNDDMLTCDALDFVASAIEANADVDMIYSDECKIDGRDAPTELFTKPDWSPSMLFNCMYTGHLSVYRKSLVDQVGGFRSTFDFSQDYDLALRISEIAKHVHHIDRVLYGWRMIAGSAAQGDKPHARATNVAALQDAAKRRKLQGEAFGARAANHFRVSHQAMTEKVSIVIPSDNLKNIKDSIATIIEQSLYRNYEILVVTNSKLIKKLDTPDLPDCVEFVAFDRPFNFSLKCNEGAARATGDIIIFFNDDVRVVSQDWIEMILEGFAIDPNVGIVGPKLLYENYLIQHAGMVTGVRGLVGTAFHCLPHETDRHFSMALWLREVSLICGACLAIRRDVFNQIGGYDAVNAPISHSDVDLCFRVRELGKTCVYTPHATLIHIGHMSIGETEKAEVRSGAKQKKDKSDIFLLRRWGKEVSYDPYFPPAMRDILYHDSPDAWQLYADVSPTVEGGKDILLISHDLSGSGAPRVVFEMARVLREAGHFVVVASPADGVFRRQLNDIGVPVIIDELLMRQHSSVERFAKNFDLVIANTVVTWPAIKQLSTVVDTYWYIHEISLLEHLLNVQPEITDAFDVAKGVWVGSDHAAVLAKRLRANAQVIKYGVLPHREDPLPLTKGRFPLNVSLMGSYEPRKGQDLAVAAFGLLPPEYRSKLRLNLYGRVLDEAFFRAVETNARKLPDITIRTEIPYERYVEEMVGGDAVLVASRDDTLPLVSIDALGVAKVLMCTNTTGTSSYIQHGVSGFVSRSPDPQAIADMLREFVDRAADLPDIAMRGKRVFDDQFSVNAFTKTFFNACGIASAAETRIEYADA